MCSAKIYLTKKKRKSRVANSFLVFCTAILQTNFTANLEYFGETNFELAILPHPVIGRFLAKENKC